jgi:signal transduction histidine kinase
MRAKQSSTASGIFSRSGPFTAPIPIRASAGVLPRVVAIRTAVPIRSTKTAHHTNCVTGMQPARSDISVAQGEGLLHDTRNLMGALRLYCDLLSLPGVLKPEHGHYADELRLLGARSGTLMERLALSLPTLDGETKALRALRPARPVCLREVLERCSGLLEQVAGGRAIELNYGPAASTLVAAGQEDIERILVNLVRNAAAALEASARTKASKGKGQSTGTVRIEIGVLQNRVGDPKPWPFRRVRLTVEDSGCGMAPEQVERLLRRSRAPSRGSHGIGFCVVRELVAAGDGDLRVMSSIGVGTRVQIEWPVATGGTLRVATVGAISRRSGTVEGAWPVC